MKKFLLFPILVLMTAVIMPACSDDDKDKFPPETPEAATYTGTLIVNNSFTKENTDCEITFNENGDKLTLKINGVKFAEAMPVTIDLSVEDIPCTTENEKTIFSGNNIVPMMGVVPAENYTFSNINGSIENSELKFNATLTKGSFTLSGVKMAE